VRVILTGGSGFLGRHVLDLLRHLGVAVWTLGRSLPCGQLRERHVFCDLLADDPLACHLLPIAPTHLLHLAWVTDPASYRESPLNSAWIQATQRLTQAFGQAGGRHMVSVGSCAEYDWSHGWCNDDALHLSPSTPYGLAKDATRMLLQTACAADGIRFAWARVFFPFGIGQSPQRLIPSLVSVLRGRQSAFVTQTLQRRDFISAPDVARALWVLLKSPAHGCYNICCANPVSIEDLIRLLAGLLHADPQPLLAMAAAELQQPELVAGENQRLKSLGWQPGGTLSDSLSQYLADIDASAAR